MLSPFREVKSLLYIAFFILIIGMPKLWELMLLNVENLFSFYITVQSVSFSPFFIIKLNQYVPNLEAVDAKQIYPKEYTIWREDPTNFLINGRYPVRDLWKVARDCWKEMLLSPVRFPCSWYLVFQLMNWKWSARFTSYSTGRKHSSCDSQIYLKGINLHCFGPGPREVRIVSYAIKCLNWYWAHLVKKCTSVII